MDRLIAVAMACHTRACRSAGSTASASGRHLATYTGPDLLRHVAPTTFQAKIDAEGWLHEERKLIQANEWSPPKHRAEKARAASKTPDFETYAKKWIAMRRTDKGEPLRASTRANYE